MSLFVILEIWQPWFTPIGTSLVPLVRKAFCIFIFKLYSEFILEYLLKKKFLYNRSLGSESSATVAKFSL